MQRLESRISGGFWGHWQVINARAAIFHQWNMLEASGCIDNFRILAEGKDVFRGGWFFADSDAYKWLEAASLILPANPDPRLNTLVADFIDLLRRAQAPDGYLFTYNQIHFPGTRWVNLQIEHELYCHGHLIDAGVSRYQSGGVDDLLAIARKAADRIVADFKGKGALFTPGHEEIEIALLRLYEVSGQRDYLDLAEQFLEMRGRQPLIGLSLLKQSRGNAQRMKAVQAQEAAFRRTHPGQAPKPLPPGNFAKKPAHTRLRWVLNAFSGKMLQQHQPLKKQIVPVGHAVRFTYLKTAAAMHERLAGTRHYLPSLEASWRRMTARRTYLTGGIGSLPEIEGFGRDYELDPEFAYAETCAALGSLFWNREMARLTGSPAYSDLFEWQLYNAALVGMGLDGQTYLYNNPLAARGDIQRREWYAVPCCPSNLSRTWAVLQNDILTASGEAVSVQQYISSTHRLELGKREVVLELDSRLPWDGQVTLRVQGAQGLPLKLKLRQPSWSAGITIQLNGSVIKEISREPAGTLDPGSAEWIEIAHPWLETDRLELDFALPVRPLRTHPRVKGLRGQAALSRGPLVYCLETIDNPAVDIFNVSIDPPSLHSGYAPDLLGGTGVIQARSTNGQALTFIPYHLWGNRGRSQMTVFITLPQEHA